jgi:hypothetical protein
LNPDSLKRIVLLYGIPRFAGEPSKWKEFLGYILHGLGANLTALGMEYTPPLTIPGNGCLSAAQAAGVQELYVWVDTPVGSNVSVSADWEAFGYWIYGSADSELNL